jgi:tRNA pseudouridine38-40 synthase
MRLAVELYYDGRNFYGSQVQPDKRTVEGELLKGLEKYGIRAGNFQRAARTDRGVSALGNVYAFDADSRVTPRALNSFLPRDIRALSIQEVPADFHPRFEAVMKVYKYFLYDEGYSLRKMQGAAEIFVGEHSFHNFSRIEGKKNPVRKLNRIEVNRRGDILILTFLGESFLWEMVRRMVSALKAAGKGGITRDELRKCFDPNLDKKFPPSPAAGLILWKVKYPFEFIREEYSRKQLVKSILRRVIDAKTRAAMEEAVIEGLD